MSSSSLILNLGTEVLISGIKAGTLRYLGRVHFAEGEWCGVELSEPEGLHDGAVGGVRYFTCSTQCGIFAPRFKVTSRTSSKSDVKIDGDIIRNEHFKNARTSSDYTNSLEDLTALSDDLKTSSLPGKISRQRSGSIRCHEEGGLMRSMPLRCTTRQNARPKSALVATSWSSQKEAGVMLKSNLMDINRRTSVKHVTFSDEHDLDDMISGGQSGYRTTKERELELSTRTEQFFLTNYRTDEVENHQRLLTSDSAVSSPLKQNLNAAICRPKFDEREFDLNLDLAISDISTPDTDCGLMKLSDESVDFSLGKDIELNENDCTSQHSREVALNKKPPHSLQFTDIMKNTNDSPAKIEKRSKDHKSSSRSGSKTTSNSTNLVAATSLFADVEDKVVKSFRTSASLELAKTALTQYADLLKAAQADREKAAGRRKPASPRHQPHGPDLKESSLNPQPSPSNPATTNPAPAATSGPIPALFGSSPMAPVPAPTPSDLGDSCLSDSVDSLNAEEGGRGRQRAPAARGGTEGAPSYTDDEEMEFETFEGEELNVVTEDVSGGGTGVGRRSSDSETDCDFQMANNQDSHYRLIGNNDDLDIDLEDSFTPAITAVTNDDVTQRDVITKQLDNQGNFTSNVTMNQLNEWKSSMGNSMSSETATSVKGNVSLPQESRLIENSVNVQQSAMTEGNRGKGWMIPGLNRLQDHLCLPDSMLSSGYLSDSVGPSMSDSEGPAEELMAGGRGLLVWRNQSADERQERPMSLISNSSTDTDLIESDVANTSALHPDCDGSRQLLDQDFAQITTRLPSSSQSMPINTSKNDETARTPTAILEPSCGENSSVLVQQKIFEDLTLGDEVITVSLVDDFYQNNDGQCQDFEQIEKIETGGIVTNARLSAKPNIACNSNSSARCNDNFSKNGEKLNSSVATVACPVLNDAGQLASQPAVKSSSIRRATDVQQDILKRKTVPISTGSPSKSALPSGTCALRSNVSKDLSESQDVSNTRQNNSQSTVERRSSKTEAINSKPLPIPLFERGGLVQSSLNHDKSKKLGPNIGATTVSSTTILSSTSVQSRQGTSQRADAISQDMAPRTAKESLRQRSMSGPPTSQQSRTNSSDRLNRISRTEAASSRSGSNVNSVDNLKVQVKTSVSARKSALSSSKSVDMLKQQPSPARPPRGLTLPKDSSTDLQSSKKEVGTRSRGSSQHATGSRSSHPSDVRQPKYVTSSREPVASGLRGPSSATFGRQRTQTRAPSKNDKLVNASNAQLEEITGKLVNAERLLEATRLEQQELKVALEGLREQQGLELSAKDEEHRTALTVLRDLMTQVERDHIDAVIKKHLQDIETLKEQHEKQLSEQREVHKGLMEKREREIAETLQNLRTEHLNKLMDLEKVHTRRADELTSSFEETKKSLSDEVARLNHEVTQQREELERLRREDAEQRGHEEARIEEATRTEAELRRQACLEAESLRVVLEQRNEQIHKFHQQMALQQEKLEELPQLRATIVKLEQKTENLEAIVSMKNDHEKQMAEMQQALLRRCERETKDKNRLSMNNDELHWRLTQSEVVDQPGGYAYSPPGGGHDSHVTGGHDSHVTGDGRMSRSYDASEGQGRRAVSLQPGRGVVVGVAAVGGKCAAAEQGKLQR